MTQNKNIILVYGTRWCGDTQRVCRFLDEHGVSYQFIDIDRDKKAEAFVRKTNDGARSVPTIVLPGGMTLTEPNIKTLAQSLGIQ
mgnify:CR=1 FL=1